MNILTAYHPALLSLQSVFDQFPGALEFFLFCNDNGIKAYHCAGKNEGLFVPADISSAENKILVQKFRKAKKEIVWTDKDDLPVNPKMAVGKRYEIKQLSIQDEIEQNVLVFRLPSLNDDASDVFAIRFSKTFSNFYIPSGRNVLSSDLKKSIGKTIRNQVVWLYDLHQQQQRNIGRIQNAYRQSADALEDSRTALERERAANKDLLERYLSQLVREQEIHLNCQIIVKNGFLEKMQENDVPIEAIKQLVEDAVLTAFDLAFDKQYIELTPNFINVNNQHIAPQIQKSAQLVDLDKTQALLEKYEQAARQLEQRSMRINGRNLAEELAISGPAVTDAIKKHGAKIRRLLEKYPTRWPLICDFIRPIREIKWSIKSQVS